MPWPLKKVVGGFTLTLREPQALLPEEADLGVLGVPRTGGHWQSGSWIPIGGLFCSLQETIAESPQGSKGEPWPVFSVLVQMRNSHLSKIAGWELGKSPHS